ncbi:cupin domain-containing protein [Alphaproteobacteria bacterium]|nr:cupin domain-containing protein [Alphaproteobacteria bacterium]
MAADRLARVAVSIFTYQPGSRFSEHRHDGRVEFLVFDVVFSAVTDDFGVGTCIRDLVGLRQAKWSDAGTTFFAKLAQFDLADRDIVRREPGAFIR